MNKTAKNRVYYKVSEDEYELIVAIADTARELATLCGVDHKTVFKGVERYEKGLYNSPYRRIEINE